MLIAIRRWIDSGIGGRELLPLYPIANVAGNLFGVVLSEIRLKGRLRVALPPADNAGRGTLCNAFYLHFV